MGIVCIATMIFVDPGQSTRNKWIFWCLSPLIAIACFGLAFNSVLAAVGWGVGVIVYFVGGYFRYWL
jgi:hypothetical protein